MMMGIPYLIMGGFGVMFWRQVRRRRRQERDIASVDWKETPGV